MVGVVVTIFATLISTIRFVKNGSSFVVSKLAPTNVNIIPPACNRPLDIALTNITTVLLPVDIDLVVVVAVVVEGNCMYDCIKISPICSSSSGWISMVTHSSVSINNIDTKTMAHISFTLLQYIFTFEICESLKKSSQFVEQFR